MKRAALALAGAAAGFAWYHGQVPTSQLYGSTIHRVRGAGRRIALTYDDGPNPRCTEPLIEVLERHGALATFFVIGKWAEREPALLRALTDAGHALGNHTFSHPTMPLRTSSQIEDELRRCREVVEAAGAAFSEVDGAALMRPPYGRRRPGTLRAVRAAGYVPVTWSITSWDWRRLTTERRIARRVGRSRDGDIVLLHDGTHTEPEKDRFRSIAATDEVLGRMRDEGYRFVTVPELVDGTGGDGAGEPR